MTIASSHWDPPRRTRILGIPLSAVTLDRAGDLVALWPEQDGARTVFVRDVASLMAAVGEPRLARLHDQADLIVADGAPLAWIARASGLGAEIGRVPGADLVDAVCRRSAGSPQTHFFFGGKPGVAEEMARRLGDRHPGLKVAGTLSPPMREIGPDFAPDAAALQEFEAIKAARPDFIWVGLSSPKQEYWMMKAAPILGHGVLFGVGAAFDFHSGAIPRAPAWMRKHGLEWLHRLLSEPRRLWRRYLVLAPQFLFEVAKESALGALGVHSTPVN